MARDGGPRLERWQTLLAAVVAGAATIVVAVISLMGGNGSDGGSPSSPSQSQTSQSQPLSLSFTSWTEKPATPLPGKQYIFLGRVFGLPSGWAVFVVVAAPGPQPDASGTLGPAEWLVSPPATVADDGHWSVHWLIKEPPTQAQWIAVVHESCPPDSVCAPQGAQSELQLSGPNASGVRATAAAPRK
jgi:hypothetical protein